MNSQTSRAILLVGIAAWLCYSSARALADVGIGTEAPSATLHVVGETAAAGTDLRVENLDPIGLEDDFSVLVSDDAGNIQTSSLEHLASALNGVGGGGDPGNDPAQPDDDWRAVVNGTELTVDSAIYTNNRVGIGTPFPAYELDIDGDIRATGSVFASDHVITHATFATSDRRFKQDIQPLDDGLAKIRAMSPKQFRYTSDAPVGLSGQTYYGLIAQDAAVVDPNLVGTFQLPIRNSDAEKVEYLGVDSQRLIFTLISAVQALDHKDREIDALQLQVQALEARLLSLETGSVVRAKRSSLSLEPIEGVRSDVRLLPSQSRARRAIPNSNSPTL